MQKHSKPPHFFDELVEQFKKTLKTGKNISQEHRDYVLMKEIYHCSPNELEEVPERKLNLHFAFLMSEREFEYIQQKRAEQRTKQKSSLRKQ